jgi:sugar phosphate isomerase/epimerase
MTPLELAIVSDEIAPDFSEAVRHALGWGIRKFELRVLKSGRVPHVIASEVDEVTSLIGKHQLQITALSPGIFKLPLSQRRELEHELTETLPLTLELARKLGTRMVILFGFRREDGEIRGRYDEAVSWMDRAAELARREEMTLAIENEPGFWADTGVNTRKLIKDVGSKALGANWDPCNAFGTAERPYPEGYEALKDVIVNVHVKDTAQGALIRCVPVGDGEIDWAGQMEALMRERIVPHVTIETHCTPLLENSRKNVETLRRMMRGST